MVILILALFLFSLPLLPSRAHASACPLNNNANTVEGCVHNSDNGASVSGLYVYIIDCGGFQTQDYSITDTNGYFSLHTTQFNGTPCINPLASYAVSVNGVTPVTASIGCYEPNCNIVGQSADNSAWGQWAGDVSTDSNGHGSATIQLTPGRQVIVPAASLYSNSALATLNYEMQTSYSISHTIGVNVDTASVGYTSKFGMTYSSIFSVAPV